MNRVEKKGRKGTERKERNGRHGRKGIEESNGTDERIGRK